MNTTKEYFSRFRTDFKKALAQLERDYDVVITPKDITYDTGRFTIKAEVTDASIDFNKETWDSYCRFYGFTSADRGKSFINGNHSFKIITIKPTTKKFPIIVLRDDGVEFGYTVQAVKTGIEIN